jgi:hypothetical protein
MHSGWGALAVLSNSAGSLEVIDRRRIAITAPETPGAKQPYHYAATLELKDAEKFICNCFAASERLASAALRELIDELNSRQYCVVGSAVLRASGRPLPPLSKILASHALIHAAEGEFFREAVWKACEGLGVAVTGFRERALDECAQSAFGKAAARMFEQISVLGTSVGPPWTKDQKTASLAALLVLTGDEQVVRQRNSTPHVLSPGT